MEDTIYKTIELENGYTLRFLDVSRKIGDDAFQVKLKAVIDITIEKSLFSQTLPDGLSVKDVQSVLGDKTAYEYEVERNFIMDHEKDLVLENLVATFQKNLGQYVANPLFPEKFVIKQYKDKTS